MTHRPLWPTIVLALFASAAMGRTPPGQTLSERQEAREKDSVVRDLAGRPVMDASGNRINYPDIGEAATAKLDLGAAPGAPAPVSSNDAFRLKWSARVMGTVIGEKTLVVADMDRDGIREVVATATAAEFGPNQYWYTLERDGSVYRQDWIGPLYGTPIGAAAVANADGDSALELLVVVGNQLLIYDGATRLLQATLSLGTANANSLSVVDVDSDGALEAVLGSPSGLFIHALSNGALEYSNAALNCTSVAVGNVDADLALEMVISTGPGAGYVLNGATRATEWSTATGFGNTVRLGDIDGDGKAEAVAEYGWNVIRVFDIDTQSIAASIATSQDIQALEVVDVEGDGPIEIVYGDGQWGSVHVLNGATRAQKWAVPNPRHGVAGMAVGDSDNDGVRELLWAAGWSDTGPDYLYVVDTLTQAVEWTSQHVIGPFFGLSHGDVDADGAREVMSTSLQSGGGNDGGFLFVHDAGTGRFEHSQTTTGNNGTGLWRVRNANIDGDAQHEIFVTTGNYSTGALICYDGLTHVQQWRADASSGESFHSLAVFDVDLDGELEVVAGTHRESTGVPGIRVYVFDAATGSLEWQGPILMSGWGSLNFLRVANVDADANPEIVVANVGGQVFVIDGVLRTTDTLPDLNVTALETADRNGDGIAEIFVANEQGVVVISPSTGAVVQSVLPWQGEVTAIAVVDIDGVSGREYVLAVGNEVVVARAGGCQIWRSGVIGSNVGLADSMLVADIDGNGRIEIVVNIGYAGVDVFETGVLPNQGCPVSASVGDGTFEAGVPWPSWTTQTSTNYGTPLCNAGLCGTGGGSAAPYAGGNWAWFGGSTQPEFATLGQTVTLPVSAALTLRFQMRIGAVNAPFTDSLVVSIDGTPVRTFNEPSSPEAGYTLREVDITPFANGGAHALLFSYANPNAGIANFTVDNVEITGFLPGPGPTLTINDASSVEGHTGVATHMFTVFLSPASSSTVTVNYATAPDTADAADFVATSGTLTFSPGQTSRTIAVQVNGDVAIETDETYFVNLTAPVSATISDSRGKGTIVNDEIPGLFIDDVTMPEGRAGSADAVFTVFMLVPSAETVTVSATTSDVTATAPGDYTPTGPVTLTFPPGVMSQTFSVPVIGDLGLELDEKFKVTLSNAVNTPIVDGVGFGTILNDDLPSRSFVSASGNDASNCTIQTTPCRRISAAMTQTEEEGEIIILTPGEYETASLTIAKSIKITSPSGTVAFIRQPINVNAAGGRVVLRGLTLKGNGTGDALTLTAADSLSIEDTTADRWATGLKLANTAATQVTILNSTFRANVTGVGEGAGGPVNVVAIEDSRFERNTTGVQAQASSLHVRESLFTGNTTTGLLVGPGMAEVRQSVFSLNGTGIGTVTGGTVRVSRSHVFGNTVGFAAGAGSTFESFGTNVVRGNGTDTAGTITPVPEQ